MAIGGAFLRLSLTLIRAVQFCASALILGVFSYFLAVLSDRKVGIPRWMKATEGISGAAVLYLIFAILLTCCLGGVRFFAFIAIVLDFCFVAGFVAVAVMTRGAATANCSSRTFSVLGQTEGYGPNGFGTGRNENVTYSLSPASNCRLEKACFAVAIINIVLFIVSALVQLALGRRTQRDKKYGPSPSNGYTSGARRGFFGRKKKVSRDAEMATAAGGVRPSHDTAHTASTADGKYGTTPGYTNGPAVNGGYANNGYTRGTHGANF